MSNLTSVGVTAGVPNSGTGTVSTLDNLPNLVLQGKVTDGTNTAAVKAANASPVATDPALVVAISPNSVNSNGQKTSASSAPVVIASDQSAIPVSESGTFTVQPGNTPNTTPWLVGAVTATLNGATPSRINAAASTNATSLKASGGQVYSIDVFNVAAYNVFLKLYNKASAPTVGTDTPFMTIPVQSGGGVSLHWANGLPMGTGISYAVTKLQADSDTTAVAAGDLTGLALWI